jgi:hypothetical protein
MNSLYLEKKNQELLWKTINQIPFLDSMEFHSKIKWFKSIIEYFYDLEPNVKTFDQLKAINIKTIQFMCRNIELIQGNNRSKLETIPEEQPVNFSGGFLTKDEPIQNIELLIKNHHLEWDLLNQNN